MSKQRHVRESGKQPSLVKPRGWVAYLPITMTMWLVYVIHGIDRSVLMVLLSPIQKEFSLTDSQVGLISGLGYALPFALAGIPIGLLADRVNRSRLLAILLGVWSLFTIASGFTKSFFSLLLCRGVIGAAEGGGPPTMISMLADASPLRYRPLLMSIFLTGPSAGIFVGSLIAGQMSDFAGWRSALFVAGIPGIILSILIYFFMRAPERGFHDPQSHGRAGSIPIAHVLVSLIQNKGRLLLAGAMIMSVFVSISISAWLSLFFVRVHGFSVAQAGTIAALVFGVFGGIGGIISGIIASRFGKGRQHWVLCWCALTMLISVPVIIAAVMLPKSSTAIVVFCLWALISSGYLGPSYSTMTQSVPAHFRATGMAIIVVLANLIGAGLGPLSVGWISDALGGVSSPAALRE